MDTLNASPSQQVDGLRHLLECNKDAQAWFQIMADECYDCTALIGWFSEISENRLRVISELRERLRMLGDNGEGSVSRLLARAWRDTASLFGKDTRALRYRLESTLVFLDGCLDEYAMVLRSPWPDAQRQWIEAQEADLRHLHDQVADLLHDSEPTQRPS